MTDQQPKYTVGPKQNTPEWLAERQNGIGASEAAAACGLDPYRQPLDLFLAKRGRIVEEEEPTDAQRLGHALEPVVLSEYEHRTGIKVAIPPGMFRSVERPWQFASLDGIAMTDKPFPLNAKTTTWRSRHEFGDDGTDDLPEAYLLQAQQEMDVYGADVAQYPVLFDARHLRIYTIERHDVLIGNIRECTKELWERIQNGDPPEPHWEHPGVLDTVKRAHAINKGKVIELSPELTEAWRHIKAMKDQIKEMEEAVDRQKAVLLHQLGDAYRAKMADGQELVRSFVDAQHWTAEMVAELQNKIGHVKRKAHFKLYERKSPAAWKDAV